MVEDLHRSEIQWLAKAIGATIVARLRFLNPPHEFGVGAPIRNYGAAFKR